MVSTLNPQAIIGNSKANFNSFGNFMTSGNLENFSSGLSNASNKIVGFDRPKVTPITPDISSLISNISTNITNKFDNSIKNTTNIFTDNIKDLRLDFYNKLNELSKRFDFLKSNDITKLETQIRTVDQQVQLNNTGPEKVTTESKSSISQLQSIVQNIQVQVNNVLDNTLRSFSKDYQDKVKGFDDNRPSNILSKFLDLYKNAIGFVNFFGDRKNIGVIEKNLKALRKIFEESFEVAAVLRQTIIKIVKQLSNLPTASPSSGGLNLDIDIPGGRLKQAGGPSVSRVGRLGNLGAIAGSSLLAAGGLAAATSGMGRAKEYQEGLLSAEVSPVSGEQYIPENIVESFSSIVDRFTSAVENLIKGVKSSPGSSGGGTTKSFGGGSSSSSKNNIVSSGPGVEGLADFIAGAESGGRFDAYSGDNGKGNPNIPKMTLTELQKTYGNWDTAVGAYQFMPGTAIGLAKQMGLDPSKTIFTPDIQKKLNIFHLNQMGYNDFVSGKISKQEFGARIARQYRALPVPGTGSTYQDKYSSRNKALRTDLQFLEALEKSKSSISSQVQSTTKPSQVAAAQTQTQATQNRVGNISKPAQQVPQIISLPPTIVDAGSMSQQQSESSSPTIPPAQMGSGPEVPMLPTTNPDNFLTMYSRIVYNLVDG